MTNNTRPNPAQYIEQEYGSMVGLKVQEVRVMTKEEADSYGWEIGNWTTPPMVIFFEGGMTLVPSSDPEGNEAGHLFYERAVPEDFKPFG